jgi:sugar lactone lactonase YvrE
MPLAAYFESLLPQRVASGFRFTEGPVPLADGSLLFSDIPASIIYRLAPGGLPEVWRSPSGQSNGLTLDRQRRLIACEHANRRVSRTEHDGAIVALADRYRGARLNSPNDVVVRSDGIVYFTDPPYGITPEQREQPCNGVYRILVDGTLELLASDFDRPNGLAFSPDERVLYVDDSTRRHIRAYDVSADGALSNGRLFADMASGADGVPDGMKIDVEGNVYCTGPGGLWVLTPDGASQGVLELPQLPANVTFSGPDRRTLYLTARTAVYTLRTRLAGMPVV